MTRRIPNSSPASLLKITQFLSPSEGGDLPSQHHPFLPCQVLRGWGFAFSASPISPLPVPQRVGICLLSITHLSPASSTEDGAMSFEYNNRIDRRETGRAMANNTFPCFSLPDDSPPGGNLHSEDQAVSLRPSPSEGGDLASESDLVSHAPAPSDGGDQQVSPQPAQLEANILDYIRPKQKKEEEDLDGLIDDLSRRFELIEKGKSSCEDQKMHSPKGWNKLWAFLSSLLECSYFLKDVVLSEPVRTLVEKIGEANVATAGLLAVTYVLEIVEKISENNEEGLRLLKEIFFLAQLVKQLKYSQKGMKSLIDTASATYWAVEGAKTLCTQIESNGLSKFWKVSIDKKKLDEIKEKIIFMYLRINAQMGVSFSDANELRRHPRLSRGYPDHAVGIEDSFKEVIGLLEWGSNKNAVAVILYGFGGIGKTTLADAVFSRVNFDRCQYSMVELSENIDSTTIVELQKDILRDLMGTKNIPEFRKHEEGRRLLGGRLKEVPALIYIDGVCDKDHLRQLLPLDLAKSKKVRLLITARDINVRKACQMETPPKEYRMGGISSAAAKRFLEKQMPAGVKSLLANENMKGKLNSKLDHIIQRCGGVPLLLTLVEQELRCAKDTGEIYQVIEELEKMEGEEFGEKLESHLAYDKLPKQCKAAFLDICSFFEGWEWDDVADIVGKTLLDKLERRALVSKGTNGVVTVHDLILEIGRRKSEGMRFRFSTTSELHEDEKVEQLRYLSYKPATNLNKLIKMPSKLKYMEIDGKLQCNDLESFPMRLLCLPDLRILKLTKFERLKELPSELANLVKGLRQLTLSNCKSFKELPYSISKLRSLRVLKVDHCKSFKVLPKELGNLTSLVELDLSNCPALSELPEDFGLLNALQVLNLEHCESLQMLPDGFESLTSLKELNLSSCKRLNYLPLGLGNLTSLVKLDLTRCEKLISIPENIGLLKSLPSMDISWCSALKELPDGFCNLSITKLKLTRCTNLEKLPDIFGSLKCLRVLRLKSCQKLQKLPESFSQLECLVHLDLSSCCGLEKLCESVHGLSSLRTLSLDSCKNLKEIPRDFHSLSSLRHLDLSNCHMLKGEWMDTVVKVKSLAMVYIRKSAKLIEKWGEMQRDHFIASFTVDRGQDLSEEERENTWKDLSSEFDKLHEYERGEPFNVCSRPLNTILLVMFDGHSDFKQDFAWPLIEETLDDIKINFEIIYIGKHFNKLPRKVANKIMTRSVDNSDARLLFEKVFFTLKRNGANLWHQYMNKSFAMSTKIVEKDDGNKYLSCWELLSEGNDYVKMEEFLLSKCGKYHTFKQLAEETQESNIHLLRELFVNGGENNCLLGKANKVGVEEMKGKTILIEIKLASENHGHNRLQSLKEMYMTEKDSLGFEIISIPVGELATKFDPFSRVDVPWLVVQNPHTVRRAVKYFLSEGYPREAVDSERWESWYPSRIRKIESNGKIATYNTVLSMLDRWGPEAYPFTDQKIEELRNKEWNEQKSMSHLKFLFKPLKSEVDKVMHQRKMVWIYCDGKDPYTKKERTKTFVGLIQKGTKNLVKNIHFIYVPYLRLNDEENKEVIPVTDSIKMVYYPPGVPQEKEELDLEPSLHLSQCDAIRFWARVCDLQKQIEGMDENDQHCDGTKNLLKSLNPEYLSLTLMDEDGNIVTTKGREIMGIFDHTKGKSTGSVDGPTKKQELPRDTAQKLVRDMIQGPKEERKKATLDLESLLGIHVA